MVRGQGWWPRLIAVPSSVTVSHWLSETWVRMAESRAIGRESWSRNDLRSELNQATTSPRNGEQVNPRRSCPKPLEPEDLRHEVGVCHGQSNRGINHCERRGSNPHAFRHRNLNPARLPIPPLSRPAMASNRRPYSKPHDRFGLSGIGEPGPGAGALRALPVMKLTGHS